jgi:uncharacterized protein DUF4338
VEGKTESRRWRKHVERYHYLGCRVPFGANLRYWVRNRDRELACMLWTSPAWKMQARDAWIEWSDDQRRRNLQSIVNNGPISDSALGARQRTGQQILALSARQMPRDCEDRYECRPLLLETLVDGERFRGTCYRAANWIHVGRPPGAVASRLAPMIRSCRRSIAPPGESLVRRRNGSEWRWWETRTCSLIRRACRRSTTARPMKPRTRITNGFQRANSPTAPRSTRWQL